MRVGGPQHRAIGGGGRRHRPRRHRRRRRIPGGRERMDEILKQVPRDWNRKNVEIVLETQVGLRLVADPSHGLTREQFRNSS